MDLYVREAFGSWWIRPAPEVAVGACRRNTASSHHFGSIRNNWEYFSDSSPFQNIRQHLRGSQDSYSSTITRLISSIELCY